MSVRDLLIQAITKRKALSAHTNAMRLVNGAGDGLPGILLDRFGLHFCAQIFDKAWHERMPAVTAVLQEEFGIDYFILKDRSDDAASDKEAIKTQVIIGQGQSAVTVVDEYGLLFGVDLNDGLNAGLFLDMRDNRYSLARHTQEKRVLNCFAYTCSFGVHARAYGARDVVNVDISKKALERGLANYKFNNLIPGPNEFVRADAGTYLSRAVKKENRFDVIIIDPPSFARLDDGVFQVKRDLPKLIYDAVQVLNDGGELFVATNFNGLTFMDIESMIEDALGKRTMKHRMRVKQDRDFPGTNTFKESYLVGIWAVI